MPKQPPMKYDPAQGTDVQWVPQPQKSSVPNLGVFHGKQPTGSVNEQVPSISPTDVLSGQIQSILQPYATIASNFIQQGYGTDPFASMEPTQYRNAIASTNPNLLQTTQGTINSQMSAAAGGPQATLINELLQLLQSQSRYGYNVYGQPSQYQQEPGAASLLQSLMGAGILSSNIGQPGSLGLQLSGLAGAAQNPAPAPQGQGATPLGGTTK